LRELTCRLRHLCLCVGFACNASDVQLGESRPAWLRDASDQVLHT